MTGRILYIYLSDDEWGNETMHLVAAEAFNQCPDVTCIEVHEHGGWWLTFAAPRDGSKVYPQDLLVVSTANDSAVMTDRAMAFWKAHPSLEWAGEIRRGKEMAA